MTNQNYLRGSLGERLAVKYLEGLGYKIIKTNFRIKGGEIDIIAVDNNILTFVEVKYYGKNNYFHPLEVITNKKMGNIISSAKKYYYTNKIKKQCRYDVLAIENIGDKENYILIKDAFREYKNIR